MVVGEAAVNCRHITLGVVNRPKYDKFHQISHEITYYNFLSFFFFFLTPSSSFNIGFFHIFTQLIRPEKKERKRNTRRNPRTTIPKTKAKHFLLLMFRSYTKGKANGTLSTPLSFFFFFFLSTL